jgi:hypothetical protein
MGIGVDVQTDMEDACYLRGQENEIFEVMVNLLRNAVEARDV